MPETLTAEFVRTLFSYDPETGLLTRKFTSGGRSAGSIAGRMHHKSYIVVKIKKRAYQAHRVAWVCHTGQWPKGQIDHINGNKADNRFCNLRDVDAAVNSQNIRFANRKNSLGLLGVCYHKRTKKYMAQISWLGRNLYIGVYKNANEAHEAYLKKKRELHGGCTI